MNSITSNCVNLSRRARERIVEEDGRPRFVCDWSWATFAHFRIAPGSLQPYVPFELDLHDGFAWISLVAFTMRGMRPAVGGRLAALPFLPIATHSFLNVRTYVHHGDDRGIHFLAEWLDSRLATLLGPHTYGLPYRYGRLRYAREPGRGQLSFEVRPQGDGARLRFRAAVSPGEPAPCDDGSADGFLLERYTAFTARGRRRWLFRVWHEPWPQIRSVIWMQDDALLRETFLWYGDARLVFGNHSPGVRDVWMSRPHAIDGRRAGVTPL